MSYFLSLKYVNIDFRFSFDRSPRTLTENNRSVESQAIWKVRGQKRKSVTHTQRAVHSVGVTQLGCDMGFCMVSPASPVSVSLARFPFMLVLPWESPVSDLVRLGVATRVHCSKANFVSHEPLPTVCLYSQVPFFCFCFRSPYLILPVQ